jgi:hypothetical protein
LEPLARKLNLPIEIPFSSKDYKALAKLVFEDTRLEGKTVVVCWVHDDLPDLAGALGVKHHPAKWKSSEFDRVWLITFHKDKAQLSDLPQHLMPGDSAK